VHQVVGVEGRGVARGALRLAEEQFWPRISGESGANFFGVEFSVQAEAGRGRKIEQFLNFAMKWTWLPRLQRIDALRGGGDLIAIEVGGRAARTR